MLASPYQLIEVQALDYASSALLEIVVICPMAHLMYCAGFCIAINNS